MIVETLNGMKLHYGNVDAFTGKRLKGLNNMHIYIDTGSEYEMFWISEESFFVAVNCFNLHQARPVDLYWNFYDVQNVKKNLGLTTDKKCVDAELEETFGEPFRNPWWDNMENWSGEENNLYED